MTSKEHFIDIMTKIKVGDIIIFHQDYYYDYNFYIAKVSQISKCHYNKGYDTPTHSYKFSELTVVKVEITTDMEEIEVRNPTYEEMSKWKAKGNKKDYQFYMFQKKEHPDITYYFYDLMKILRDKKE